MFASRGRWLLVPDPGTLIEKPVHSQGTRSALGRSRWSITTSFSGGFQRPHGKRRRQYECQAIPGQGISKVLVGQPDDDLAGFGKPPGGTGISARYRIGAAWPMPFAAAIGSGSRTNQRLCAGSSAGENQFWGSGQRITPAISTVPQSVRPAASCDLPGLRHEAAVDHDISAASKPRRREDPKAQARHVRPEGR